MIIFYLSFNSKYKGRYLIYSDQLPDSMYFVCLEIDDVTVEDAGKYKVTAKNNLGETNGSITLNFDSKYLKIFLLQKHFINRQFYFLAEDTASNSSGKPVFLQKPFIRQLEDKILFECKLTADPVPVFTWHLDNNIIKNPTKYKQRCLTFYP